MKGRLLVAAALLACLASLCCAEDVRYSMSRPLPSTASSFVQVGEDGKSYLLEASADGCVHETTVTATGPFVGSPPYRFGVEEGQAVAWEAFYRVPEECRVAERTGGVAALQHEVFNQTESTLGLPPLPYLTDESGGSLSFPEGVRPPQVPFIDDNQVVTFSFRAGPDALAVLLDPNSYGDVYVSANMSYVALGSHQVLDGIEIKRSGGSSINTFPYSYQVKMDEDNNLGGITTTFKLKSYAKDYPDSGGWQASILSEKVADDMCQVLEAPINYMSLARVYLNGEYYGIYGLLEKIDDHFAQRRWPYGPATNDIGTLYKAATTELYMLNNTGWVPGRRLDFEDEGDYGDVCCPCYENSCDVEDDCNVVDPRDDCYGLNCCDCPWERYSDFDVKEANCEVQAPFYDFVSLGDAIVAASQPAINNTLAAYGYLRTLACELTVMNVDGYVYHGWNYYWYSDVTTGKFHLITYDQDSCLSGSDFLSEARQTIYNFTQNQADAMFLPRLLEDPELKQFYDTLLTAFTDQFMRPDMQGPLFDRMRRLALFMTKYNPGREGLAGRVEGYARSIVSNSDKVRKDLGLDTIPPAAALPYATCGNYIAAAEQ